MYYTLKINLSEGGFIQETFQAETLANAVSMAANKYESALTLKGFVSIELVSFQI